MAFLFSPAAISREKALGNDCICSEITPCAVMQLDLSMRFSMGYGIMVFYNRASWCASRASFEEIIAGLGTCGEFISSLLFMGKCNEISEV